MEFSVGPKKNIVKEHLLGKNIITIYELHWICCYNYLVIQYTHSSFHDPITTILLYQHHSASYSQFTQCHTHTHTLY